MADLHDFQCHSHKVGTVGDKLILIDHIPVRLVIDCPRKKQLQITLSSVDGLRNTPFMFCALYEVHRTIFTMSTDNQGLLSMIRWSGIILDIAQASCCTRSNRVLGFVHQYRVHLLMKCLCRSANSCEVGLIVVHCVSLALACALLPVSILPMKTPDTSWDVAQDLIVYGTAINVLPCSAPFSLFGLVLANVFHLRLSSTTCCSTLPFVLTGSALSCLVF